MFRLGMEFLNFKAVQLSKCHTKYLLFNMLWFNNSRPELKYVSFTFTGTRPTRVSRTSQSQTAVFPAAPCAAEATVRTGLQGGRCWAQACPTRPLHAQRKAKGKTCAPVAPRSTTVSGFPDSFSLDAGSQLSHFYPAGGRRLTSDRWSLFNS